MAIHRNREDTNNSKKHQYVRHPIQNYRRIRNNESEKIQKRKQQLIQDENVPDYSQSQNKFLLFLVGILVVLIALLKLYTYLKG